MPIERDRLMRVLGLDASEAGYTKALDFLIEHINSGEITASAEVRKRSKDALPAMVERIMEKDNVSFSRACAIMDAERRKTGATEKMLRRRAEKKLTVTVRMPAIVDNGQEVVPESNFSTEVDMYPQLVALLAKVKAESKR